jgi:serine/threonine-protein kinase
VRTIGKYQVTGLLGRGGMGRIFKVIHPVIGKIAALKLLDPHPLLVELVGAKQLRDLFISEAVTLAGLRHPNIVTILEFDETDGKPFYLMDYYVNNLGVMIGEPSRPDMPSRKISIEKGIYYINQTLQGLACLHHNAIIHRDIKPHNLLITDQDTVKICDFGLSKLRGEQFPGPPSLKVGSAWYSPPEQEEDPDAVDVSADLYATGVTLYRMLTGKLPDVQQVPASRLNADLDDAWDRFFQKAIAGDCRDRFASAEEMMDSLDGLHSAWIEKKDRVCALAELPDESTDSSAGRQQISLRSSRMKVGPKQAAEVLGTDSLRQPKRYIRNRYHLNPDETISDLTTGLVWQQSGSRFPMTWQLAHSYVDRLNDETFAASRQWRLPTIDELMSLLTETPSGSDYCIEPVFDPAQKWLWSCDRRSFTAAWYVSIDLGFVAWQDFNAYYYVRAVRTSGE